MTAASDYLEDTLLKHLMANAGTNGANYDTSTLAFYVSLHTGNPGEDNTGANEISGSGYARQAATFGNVTSGSVSTNATISFPQATSNYSADVTYIGIYDAASGGNLLFYGALSSAKTVTSGDVFQINSGSLTITLS